MPRLVLALAPTWGTCLTGAKWAAQNILRRYPAHYLIRPDGHIGYPSSGLDLDELQHCLTRWVSNTTSRPA